VEPYLDFFPTEFHVVGLTDRLHGQITFTIHRGMKANYLVCWFSLTILHTEIYIHMDTGVGLMHVAYYSTT